ncbi:ATP-binding protein [Alkalimonas sp. MEB108]|uniref:histidine kinase n=1 Tax=Alkalimonas cellulosilytica TaxID=3058395 RepID=A0ABU7J8Q8_9GAMM|nr:ATP-binding protein [Alkalimonas sp. MEB108]MEE2002270.1 ATP-binding protein [Alkalimonas sp. MEB108]
MDTSGKLLSYWQWLLLLLCLVACVLITENLVRQDAAYAKGQQLEQQVANAGHLRSFLETELNRALYLTFGLSAYVQANKGQVSATEFDVLLPELVELGQYIRNIGVAPDNRLTYVYPIEGNEAAIGLYYPDIPEQWPAVQAIIESRQALLVGPVQLLQGGIGFIHRLPVFIDDQYWGIISIVVDPTELWQELQLIMDRYGIEAALRARLDAASYSDSFFGNNALFYDDSLLLDLTIRGAHWQLAIRSTDPLKGRTLEIRLVGYSVTLLLLALISWLTFSRHQLQHSSRELQVQQQYLSTVMDNVADAIITTDANGHIERINQAAADIFGLSMQQLEGVHWSSLLDDPQQQQQLLLATTTPGKVVKTRGRNRFDQPFPLELSRSEIEFNQLTKNVILLRDMTEQHKVDRLKNEFVSTVSHELRTPLTAINGSIGLVLGGVMGSVSPQTKQLLQTAYDNCDHLTQLINDLLDIEKLEAGKMRFQLQPIALAELVEQCLQQNQPLATESRLQLKLQTRDHHLQVRADPLRLQQVITNLLSNAIKYAPRDSTVLLRLSLDGNKVRLEVRDQGPGVPEHFQPSLFQKFAQADSADNKAKQGSGLGLAIARSLIQAMDGDIGYQPIQPHGSCFYLTLPLSGYAKPAVKLTTPADER